MEIDPTLTVPFGVFKVILQCWNRIPCRLPQILAFAHQDVAALHRHVLYSGGASARTARFSADSLHL